MVCTCDLCQFSFAGPSEPPPPLLLITVDGCDVTNTIAPEIWKAKDVCVFYESSVMVVITLS